MLLVLAGQIDRARDRRRTSGRCRRARRQRLRPLSGSADAGAGGAGRRLRRRRRREAQPSCGCRRPQRCCLGQLRGPAHVGRHRLARRGPLRGGRGGAPRRPAASGTTGNVSRLPLTTGRSPSCGWAAATGTTPLAEAQAGLGLIGDTEFQVGDVFAHAICAHVALHRGELGAAQAAVDEARRRLVAGPVEIGYEWMSWIGALLLEAQGRTGCGPGHAGRDVGSDRPAPLPAGHVAGHGPRPGAHGQGGRRPPACRCRSPRSWSAALTRPARRPPGASRCAVVVCSTTTWVPCSPRSPCTARGPRPYLLAAACEDAGVALGRAARRARRSPLLGEAAAIYERLRASWDVARVQAGARTLGVRRTRPRSSPDVRMGEPHPHRGSAWSTSWPKD